MRGGVFVCHASPDAAVARQIVAALEAAGVPCWIAPRDISPGENYARAILDGLEAAPAVVLVFSAATNASPHVARELETSVSSGRPIIPVRLEGVEPSRELRYFIGTSQWLDTDGVAAAQWEPPLVRAVRHAVSGTPAPAAVAARPEPPSDPVSPGPDRRRVLVAGGAVLVVALVATVAVLLSRSPGGSADHLGSGSATSGGRSSASVTGASGGSVTCWDGSAAGSEKACGLPEGRKGMETVFASLTSDCEAKDPPVPGKVEVYVCQGPGYLVRYSRWQGVGDQAPFYTGLHLYAGTPWSVDGEPAGTQWSSLSHTTGDTTPYQWAVSYHDFPYSVEVEAATAAARTAAIHTVETVPPSRIGLEAR